MNGTTFQFAVTGQPGKRFEIQTSTDLRHWASGGTVTLSNGTYLFTDPGAAGPRRFYRAVPLP